jgi:peptide/nickel transport system substrate-binding protein
MLPATLWVHRAIVDRKVDLARARMHLAEAGRGDGFRTTLLYSPHQRTYLPNPDDTAIQIQKDLEQVGIDVELKKLEWTSYLQALRSGQHEICLIGWMADIGDPDGFLHVLLDRDNARPGSSTNYAWYGGERVHELLLEARATLDQPRRAALYGEVQEIVFDEVPVLPLATVRDYRVLRADVRGYTIYPAGGEYFRHVSLAK